MKQVTFFLADGVLKPSCLFNAIEVFEKANEFYVNSGLAPYYDIQLAGVNLQQRLLNISFSFQGLQDITAIKKNPLTSGIMPRQESGVRSACALPYELYVDGKLSDDKKVFEIQFKANNEIFGEQSLGSPFNVYAPGIYQNEAVETWAYTASAGDALKDNWPLADFENNLYHLNVYGPNGFFREFKGTKDNPVLEITCDYEHAKMNAKRLTGNIVLRVKNNSSTQQHIQITDNAYKTPLQTKTLMPAVATDIMINLDKSRHWYDITIKIKGHDLFEASYAGHVETGEHTTSDPAMGRVA